MPTTQDPTEQVKFLVCCIGHSSNGRPDFAAVAEELGIVSKAAAHKRYERMLKANGISGNKSPTKGNNDGGLTTPEATPVKRKAAASLKARGAKKAKGKSAKGVKKPESDDESAASAEDTKDGIKKEEDDESELSEPPASEECEV